MENELNKRLASLHLQEWPLVTRATEDKCLFVAAIHRIRDYANDPKTRNKQMVPEDSEVHSTLHRADGTEVPCILSRSRSTKRS